VIPVTPAPEPATFDAVVRQPGLQWLADENLAGQDIAPVGKTIKAFWTACLPDLLSGYGRICAYASLRIAPITGGHSVEHFAPKSRALTQTYEWDNYRLVCAKLNARKNNFTDVLDPFLLTPDTFRLNPLNGALEINLAPSHPDRDLAERTARRLGLDDVEMRTARLELVDSYLNGHFDSAFLRRESPFIWTELGRQNMLRS
jgi:hypothetical protein